MVNMDDLIEEEEPAYCPECGDELEDETYCDCGWEEE
jgi:hypothetical protein